MDKISLIANVIQENDGSNHSLLVARNIILELLANGYDIVEIEPDAAEQKMDDRLLW